MSKNKNKKMTPAEKPSLLGGRGKLEKKGKRVSYKTVVNTCPSFLNEVMASEPLFEEQSDAVKVSETPYPTNESGKNLGKEYGC